MQSRALRFVLLVVCVIGMAAAAAFIRSSEKSLTNRRAALRDFDGRARETTDALADLRTAQQAYVAVGQGTGFWMPKVDETIQTVTGALAPLQQAATSPASTSALDEAAATLAEFGNVDQRIRGYLTSGAQLMAADIVFTEGGETAASAARQIERARIEEHVAFDLHEAKIRVQELMAAGAAAGLVLLVMAIFVLLPSNSAVREETTSFNQITPSVPQPVTAAASEHDLELRREDGPAHQPPHKLRRSAEALAKAEAGHDRSAEARAHMKAPNAAGRPAEPSKSANAAALRAAALICTDIGRVADPEELKGLLSRAAAVLDASGLMLWLGTASGTELRPVVAHGYSAQMVSRIPPVPRAASNAAAAAYRSGTLQIVLSRPGSAVKGAIVAPLLAAGGCVGVLSAEIRDGGEASDTVQALAAIFAAQLAGVVAAAPETLEQRATGSGAV